MPAVKTNALSAAFVKKVTAFGAYGDGKGLTLKVDPHGKRWYQRVSVNGQRRNIGLGSYPAISLSAARVAAISNHQSIAQGGNPLQEKRQAKQDASAPAVPSFADVAQVVHELNAPTWSNSKHSHEWIQSLKTYAYPVIGRKPVGEITTGDVMTVLENLWTAKPVTAKRINQRLATVFDYCVAKNWRETNPAGRSVSKALPKPSRTVKHHTAAHYSDVPEILRKVRDSGECEIIKLSFEFAVLTAARTGEIRFATWNEISWAEKVWEIPPNE